MSVDITVGAEPWNEPDGTALRLAQQAELDLRYGVGDHEPGDKPTADSVSVFLVARDASGRAVGCAGLRPLEGGEAEIKRMYVTPEVRGTGVATSILRALEGEARRHGLVRLILETGTGQPDAIRFYEREGYRSIPNFGPYIDGPLSVCYARAL